MKRRLQEYSKWIHLNESNGKRTVVRAILDMKSQSQFIDNENVYYIVADKMGDAMGIFIDEVKGIIEDVDDYKDSRSIDSRLDLWEYKDPESIGNFGRDLMSLSAPDIHRGERKEDYFNSNDYQKIETSAKLYTDLKDIAASLERDLALRERNDKIEGPIFQGKQKDVVELLVDLAEVAPETVSRYWDSNVGQMGTIQLSVKPRIYSEFIIRCEERGIPIGEPRIKNYKIISKIYNDPVLSKIANQLVALIGGKAKMSIKELIENLIGENQVFAFLKPSTEQISALLNLAKDDLTPEEYRGYTMLLKVRGKVI